MQVGAATTEGCHPSLVDSKSSGGQGMLPVSKGKSPEPMDGTRSRQTPEMSPTSAFTRLRCRPPCPPPPHHMVANHQHCNWTFNKVEDLQTFARRHHSVRELSLRGTVLFHTSHRERSKPLPRSAAVYLPTRRLKRTPAPGSLSLSLTYLADRMRAPQEAPPSEVGVRPWGERIEALSRRSSAWSAPLGLYHRPGGENPSVLSAIYRLGGDEAGNDTPPQWRLRVYPRTQLAEGVP